MKQLRGFTLIEVLVALAIVALTMGAGARAMSALTDNTLRQSHSLLAQICADNALAQLRLSKQMPNVGESTQDCEQAGLPMRVNLNVVPTPNPSFRRADARVELEGRSILTASTVVGKY